MTIDSSRHLQHSGSAMQQDTLRSDTQAATNDRLEGATPTDTNQQPTPRATQGFSIRSIPFYALGELATISAGYNLGHEIGEKLPEYIASGFGNTGVMHDCAKALASAATLGASTVTAAVCTAVAIQAYADSRNNADIPFYMIHHICTFLTATGASAAASIALATQK